MKENQHEKDLGFMEQPIGRLGFLKYAGAAIATTGLVMAGCKKSTNPTFTAPAPSGQSDNQKLGSGNPVKLLGGDLGILQYAYALEQLEAAFYTQVIATPYSGISTAEMNVLADIKLHEICHREFFKEALGSNATSVTLTLAQLDFTSSIDFNTRSSVLGAAKAFEDLGVSAYNGAGRLFSTSGVAYLGLAGKIVSVEARHAAAIRDLLSPNTANFAGDDVINSSTGLDAANDPKDVIPTANSFLIASAKIDATALPR